MCINMFHGVPGFFTRWTICALNGCDGCKAGPHRAEPGAYLSANLREFALIKEIKDVKVAGGTNGGTAIDDVKIATICEAFGEAQNNNIS